MTKHFLFDKKTHTQKIKEWKKKEYATSLVLLDLRNSRYKKEYVRPPIPLSN